jgi:hypothetical protein
MAQLHRDNGGYLGIDVRETADPYFDNVVLLLQPKAGDTSIVDYSPSGKSITNNGVTLDSGTQKWNGADSMLFEASNNDYLSLADSDDWYFDKFDFTIEFWFYVTSGSSNRTPLSQTDGNDWFITLEYQDSDGAKIQSNSESTTYVENTGSVFPTSSWTHLAITRQGNTFRIFRGGSLAASNTSTTQLPDVSSALEVGRSSSFSNYFDGNMTGVRITKGVARYTSNFTPPTRPFPTRRYVSGIIQP